jgi:hypothetical protein
VTARIAVREEWRPAEGTVGRQCDSETSTMSTEPIRFAELPVGAIFMMVERKHHILESRARYVKKSDRQAEALPPVGAVVISPGMLVERVE